MPKVSIITYVYCTKYNNRLELLLECINSVATQKDIPTYEHIIIDDGSDIDISIVKTFKNIIYHKKSHTGITQSTETFNMGFKIATGDYCIILPSDDMHTDITLSTLSKYLDTHPNIGMVMGNAKCVRPDRSIVIWKYKGKGPIKDAILDRNYINACAVMFRRSLLRKIQLPFNEAGFAADYDLWLRLSDVAEWGLIDDCVVIYRHVQDSTRNKTGKDIAYRNKCLTFVKESARARRGLSKRRPVR